MTEYINIEDFKEEWDKQKTMNPLKCLENIPRADVVERDSIKRELKDICLFIGRLDNERDKVLHEGLMSTWFRVAKMEDIG